MPSFSVPPNTKNKKRGQYTISIRFSPHPSMVSVIFRYRGAVITFQGSRYEKEERRYSSGVRSSGTAEANTNTDAKINSTGNPNIPAIAPPINGPNTPTP